MLACQHIDKEAEVMSMLLIEELEHQPGAYFTFQDLDRRLERALDNQLYEKYRRLTEWQALKTTSVNAERRLKRLTEEDEGLLGLVAYLSEKGQDLENRAKILHKDLLKKEKENQMWRHQYHNKNKSK